MDLYVGNIEAPDFFDVFQSFPVIIVGSLIFFLVLRYQGHRGFKFPLISCALLLCVVFFSGLYNFFLERAIVDGMHGIEAKSVSGVVKNYRPKFSTLDTFEIAEESFEIRPRNTSYSYFSGLQREGFSVIKDGRDLTIWFVVYMGDNFIIKIASRYQSKL